MTTMFAYLRCIFRRQAPVPEVTVIDQGAYYDLLERRQKAWISDMRQRDADCDRISFIVWAWARDCLNDLDQKSPSSLLPGEIRSWKLGFNVREVTALANANDYTIRLHIYEGTLIPGVRSVQRLPATVLRFPPPRRETDGRAGDGRRRNA